MISDGFGPARPVDDFLADCEDWVGRRAREYTASSPWLYDDVRQEGRITLWRRYAELEGNPSQVPFAMHQAKFRMQAVAWQTNRGQLTGHTGQPGHIDVTSKPMVRTDALLDQGFDALALWMAVEAPGAIELAYHRGEILQALDSLTEGQRRYVYARFWCGMDPSGGLNMNVGMREARSNNPFLRRDVYWTGNKTTRGAKEKLAEALKHLAGAVRG